MVKVPDPFRPPLPKSWAEWACMFPEWVGTALVQESEDGDALRINLGCGSLIQAGYVNLDRVDGPGVDVVHDLDIEPWPFDTDTAELIAAKDVFEHVADPILFMTECHRILAPGGTLVIRTPHVGSLAAFTDPTHRRFPTQYTFDYWIEGTVYHTEHNAAYGAVTYQLVTKQVEEHALNVALRKCLRPAADPLSIHERREEERKRRAGTNDPSAGGGYVY